MAIRRYIILLTLPLLLVFAFDLHAAQCSNIFQNQINSNLGSNGLDLSEVSWSDGAWPPSGSTLTNGDYFFAGVTLPDGYTLSVAPGDQVRIFVSGNLSVGDNARLGSGGELLLVVQDDLIIGNRAILRGLIYAGGTINRTSGGVGNAPEIYGAMAAAGAITTDRFDGAYNGDLVQSSLLTGLCGRVVVLSANGDSAGPVTVRAGETVQLRVTGEFCEGVIASGANQSWIDRWTISGSTTATTFGASLCSRTPVDRLETFQVPGDYLVEFESRYRPCSSTASCDARLFGRDRIIIRVVEPSDDLVCFNDDFSQTSLSAENWVTSVSGGNFTPQLVDGRLRMTEAVANQSTAATLQREIPAAENLVLLEFDYYAYGGNGADGLAVVLSDASVTPRPGSFGGSLGYAQRDNGDPGFAGGWLGIGLDEFGNFSSATEGRVGGAGFIPDAVTLRGAAASNYQFLATSGTQVPGIDQSGTSPVPHRYRITLDSQQSGITTVQVERRVGDAPDYTTLISINNVLGLNGQPAVPENFLLSLTGSTGGSSNIHELGNFRLCALTLNDVGRQVDHFEIIHDGVALTCQPETVQIRACANADCSELFTDAVQATLAPANGWQGGNVVSLVNGFGEATLQSTAPGTLVLDVIGSTPSTRPQAVTLCQVGGSLSAGNCELPFFASGLAFEIPDLVSHRPSGPVQVRAVRQDDVTQQCVPAFENQTKTVEFWSDYVDPGPGGRDVSRAVSVNGESVGTDASAPTGIELAFGDDGIAEMNVIYPDAGLVQLTARYLGSEATEDAGLVMPGADNFVTVPAGFCVAAAGACAEGDASCPTFVRAGEEFAVTVTAAGWQSDADMDFCEGNPNTPNFRLLDIPLQAELVAPAGGETGEVTPASYNHGRSITASESVTARQSEVGVFRFITEPPTGAYLGRDLPVGRSDPIGRFYPDRFRVTVDPGSLEAECSAGAFTYSGQAFGWLMNPAALIEPLSVQGARTRNYTSDGFRKLNVSGISRIAPLQDNSATDSNGDPMAVAVVEESGGLTVLEPGLMQFAYNMTDAFNYLKNAESKINPFEPELTFVIDGVQDDDSVQAESAPYAFSPEAAFEIRYGRLTMENVYGPENVDALLMPFRIELFDNGRFVSHLADDACSPWATTDIDVVGNRHTLVADSGTFVEGVGGPLRLEPLGIEGTDVLTWQVPEWLKDDWSGDGELESPSANATFGVYRGNDRIIYWREVPTN